MNVALYPDIKPVARIICKMYFFFKLRFPLVSRYQIKGFRIYFFWDKPVVELKLHSFFEIDGKLSTLRAQPESFFAAECVDMFSRFTRSNQFMIDPAETQALLPFRGTGHHSSLVSRCNDHLCSTTVAQYNQVLVILPEKLKIVSKTSFHREIPSIFFCFHSIRIIA